MVGRKKGNLVIFFSLVLLISSPFVFAGLGDLWNTLTGKATTNTTQVSVTVGNTAPYVYLVNITTPSATAPTEAQGLQLIVNINATDVDGSANLYPSGVFQLRVNASGSTNYTNYSCNYAGTWNTTSVGYNCSIFFPYWEMPSVAFSINATVCDVNGACHTNQTRTYTIGTLNAMIMNTSTSQTAQLNWSGSLSPSATDQASSNDPLFVNNTGNGNHQVNMTGYNLRGLTTTTEYIFANNFTVGNASQGCDGVLLSSAQSRNMSNGTILYRGNNLTHGIKQLYVCLKGMPSNVSAQTYTSASLGNWQVEII